MKTEEEQNTFKEKVEAVNAELNEMHEDELTQVTGGGKILYEMVSRTNEVESDIMIVKNKAKNSGGSI